jgi:hypothetical protein
VRPSPQQGSQFGVSQAEGWPADCLVGQGTDRFKANQANSGGHQMVKQQLSADCVTLLEADHCAHRQA